MTVGILQYEPRRPYARASVVGKLIFLAGETGTPAHDEEPGSAADITAQTHQAMRNIESTLDEFGIGWDNLVRMDVFLVDRSHIDPFMEVLRSYLPDGAPPGVLVCVESLAHEGMLVEIECIAAAP